MQLDRIEKALVVGAGHGIGLALCEALIKVAPQAQIIATYRDPQKACELIAHNREAQIQQIDPTSEQDLAKLRDMTENLPGKLQLLINTTGWLHSSQHKPEKSLRQINIEQMLEYFRVNSITAALLGKYFLPLFRHKKVSTFASISAKVGSIEDNKIGGWYGYRSSKAALNMLLRTMAIEFQRYGCHCNILALHPGTTVTELSEPFIKNTKLKLHQPAATAENIMRIITEQPMSSEAKFISWDGTTIPW